MRLGRNSNSERLNVYDRISRGLYAIVFSRHYKTVSVTAPVVSRHNVPRVTATVASSRIAPRVMPST